MSEVGTIYSADCLELTQDSPATPRPDCLVSLGDGTRIGRQMLCLSDAKTHSGLFITDIFEVDNGMTDAGGIQTRALIAEWDRRRGENNWKATVSGRPLYKEGDYIALKIDDMPKMILQVHSVQGDPLKDITKYELGTRDLRFPDAFNARNSLTDAFSDEYLTTDDPAPTCSHETETITDTTMVLTSQAGWEAWTSNHSGGTVSGGTLTIASNQWYAKTFNAVTNEDPGYEAYTTVSITLTVTGDVAAAKLCYQADGAGDWIVARTLSTGTCTYEIPIARNRRLTVIVWSDPAAGTASLAITNMHMTHPEEQDYLSIGNNSWGTANTFKFTPGDLITSYKSPRVMLDISFSYIPAMWCELKLTVNSNASPYLIWKYWVTTESISVDITQWAVTSENTVTVAAYYHGTLGASGIVTVSPSAKIVRRSQFGI